MNLHTPGPWTVDSSNEVFPDGDGGESFSEFLTVVASGGERICELPGHSSFARGSDTTKREDANARLIAAAPELLESAQSFAASLEVVGDGIFLKEARALRAAIAKATGGAA